MRRVFTVVVIALIGASVSSCSSSTAPSPIVAPAPTVITNTRVEVLSVIPERTSGTMFQYGDSVSAQVTWSITPSDWASGNASGKRLAVYVCASNEADKIILSCGGRGIPEPTGSMLVSGNVVPNYWPLNTVKKSRYIVLIVTSSLSVHQGMSAEVGLNFPISSLPVQPLAVNSVEREIDWTN